MCLFEINWWNTSYSAGLGIDHKVCVQRRKKSEFDWSLIGWLIEKGQFEGGRWVWQKDGRPWNRKGLTDQLVDQWSFDRLRLIVFDHHINLPKHFHRFRRKIRSAQNAFDWQWKSTPMKMFKFARLFLITLTFSCICSTIISFSGSDLLNSTVQFSTVSDITIFLELQYSRCITVLFDFCLFRLISPVEKWMDKVREHSGWSEKTKKFSDDLIRDLK